MAAAEYYHGMPSGSGPQPNLVPPPRPQYLSPQPSQLYPQTPPPSNSQAQGHAPPPYQAVELPAEKPSWPTNQPFQRNSFSHMQRPPTETWNSPSPSPYPQATEPFHNQNLQAFPQQVFQQYPQHQTQPMYHKPPPHLRPYHANGSSPNLAYGYSSDPEPQRRRRSREKSNSKSRTSDGFLGAAGGGLIGDLIFPGLGTIGGAVAGYIGGKDYGKHKKYRESSCSRNDKHGKRKHSSRERRSS